MAGKTVKLEKMLEGVIKFKNVAGKTVIIEKMAGNAIKF